ncbi:LamG domain-containing protein, partial [Leucobacter sp. M11]|uniref:LamG domain-containing protein n=1 Tax=Leucobacter sp. M11 TaxID=2993565 RepID=UPI002D7F7D03
GSASGADTAQAMTQDRINAANDAYNNADATLEFITMSDTELSGSPTAEKTSEQVAYESAKPHFDTLSAWATAKGFEPGVIVDNGDVVGANDPEYSDHLAGNSEKTAGWYRAVERVMRESFPEAQVLLTQGNHDIADLMGKTFDQARAANAPADAPEWFYPSAESDYVGNFHTTVNGIDFIGLDYNGKETFGYAGQRTGYQEYLRKTLAAIAAQPDYDAGKPIFVSIHSGYAGTSLGGPFHAEYDMAGPDLQRILAEYPQAVLGSAHTHFSSNPETSIYQKDFTVYENASMNYIYQDVPGDFLGGGYFEGNQGDPEAGVSQKSANFITVLDSGETVIRRFDVTHQRWMGMPWVVNTPAGTAGFTYTDDQRSTIAPWWEAAAVTARAVTETSVTLGFDQAKDDELVNYYEIAITDQDGNPVPFTANQVPDYGKNPPKSVTGSVKAYSRFYMTPNTMGFDIAGLKPAKTYRVEVRAVDDFQNVSEALTGSFRTAGTLVFPEYPESPAPAHAGAFLNLPFEGDLSDSGTAADTAPAAAAVGAVSFVDNDRPGATGQAVRIGGGNKNYVDLGSRPEFDLGTEKNLTVSFWTKVTGVSGYGAILSNKNWSNFYRSGLNVAPQGSDTGKLEFTLGDGKNGVYATGAVPDFRNSWHQMTLTVDRASNTARTYQDGVLAGEASLAEVGSLTSGLNMLIGVDGGKSYGVALDLDDLRMWDSALTEAEVAALFAADDATAETEALTRAVEYADELVAAQESEAGNGRVLDAALTESLVAAVASTRAVLAEPAPAKAALRAGYDTLRSAVTAAEEQPVRFSYAASANNGAISPAEGVADLAGEIRFALTPASGFRIADSVVEVSGAEAFAIEGEELVLRGVQGRVSAAVTFAAVVDGGPGDGGTTPGDGGTTPGDGGTTPGNGGKTPGEQPGTGAGTPAGSGSGAASVEQTPVPGDQLAATGDNAAQTWLLAGLASALLGAAGVLLTARARLRRR